MLLGYHTSGLQNHRLGEALRLLADHGYQAVAITPDVCHLDPFRCTAREVAEVAGLLDRLGLHPVMETGARFVLDPATKHEPTLMTRASGGRERRLEFYSRVAAIGRDLGADVLSFWTGIDRSPGPDSRTWMDDGVRRACDLVRAAGLRPTLEPEPGMAIATVSSYRDLISRLGTGSPHLTLDVGHLWAEWEGEPIEVLEGIGDELLQVHLEDMRRGVHEHLAPGEGEVDFSAVHQALDRIGYSGPVCFELSRSSHRAPETVSLCRNLWARLSGGHG